MHDSGIEALPARERKQLARQGCAALRGKLDSFRRMLSFRIVGKSLLDQRDVAAHNHEQIVEIVRDASGQLTESLHFLDLRELRLGLLHRQLRVRGAR